MKPRTSVSSYIPTLKHICQPPAGARTYLSQGRYRPPPRYTFVTIAGTFESKSAVELPPNAATTTSIHANASMALRQTKLIGI